MTMSETRDAYSISEVAERYGVHRTTIYREIWDGRLAAFRLRGRTLISGDAVNAWRNGMKTFERGYRRGKKDKNGK